jgi:hypothetical protein
MLSGFFSGVAHLTHQNLLFIGFLALIFTGTFIGAKRMTENRSLYLVLVGMWIMLAFLVGVVRDGGGMNVIFTNPITVALIGAIFGAAYCSYLTLFNE